MKRLLLALALLALPTAALGQAKVVATCGTNSPGNYPTGSIGQPLTMDPSGNLCMTPSTGGATQLVTGTGTAGTAATGVVTVQGIAAMTPLLVTLSGTNNIATVTTVTTVAAVTAITNALPAGTNLLGRVVVDANAATGGISTTARLLSAAGSSGDATNVKASAGRLYSIQGYNAAGTVRYLKLYNSATAPTAGAGTPFKTLVLPPLAGFTFDWPLGYSFSTGLGFTLVTGVADNSSTSVTAADILGLNLDYN